MISYEGIDEATLVHGLYHGTPRLGLDTPAGIIDAAHGGPRVTVEELAAELAPDMGGDELYIDYYRGRPLKVRLDLKSKTFSEHLYDRDAGQGAAARVVAALRGAALPSGHEDQVAAASAAIEATTKVARQWPSAMVLPRTTVSPAAWAEAMAPWLDRYGFSVSDDDGMPTTMHKLGPVAS